MLPNIANRYKTLRNIKVSSLCPPRLSFMNTIKEALAVYWSILDRVVIFNTRDCCRTAHFALTIHVLRVLEPLGRLAYQTPKGHQQLHLIIQIPLFIQVHIFIQTHLFLEKYLFIQMHLFITSSTLAQFWTQYPPPLESSRSLQVLTPEPS